MNEQILKTRRAVCCGTKFRRSIFRLDEAVLNFVMGVTEWVMTEQNLKPTKYK